jgi:hypothetical protein
MGRSYLPNGQILNLIDLWSLVEIHKIVLRLSYEPKLQELRKLLYIFNFSSSHHFHDKQHNVQEGYQEVIKKFYSHNLQS